MIGDKRSGVHVMSYAQQSWDAKGYWAPYTPSDKAPWNLRRAVHLHRSAGFAATWKELQRDLADGPEPSVTRLLTGRARAEGVSEEFGSIADTLLRDARDMAHLKAWWLFRMYHGPDPLGERLTLLWHNHFATSNHKVQNLGDMIRQQMIFREHGRGPFGNLLKAVVHDPALLIWLDAPANRKGSPNENLARELMELFTLGIGHYTEMDVKEAARALTGWTVAGDSIHFFHEDASLHDPNEKTLLGHKGVWTGDDLVRLLLEQPATSRRLAWRLCDWVLSEESMSGQGLDTLAAGLRAHQLDFGWAVETVLRSQVFFADKNLGTRVLGPIEYLVGVARALECFDSPPCSLVMAEWPARLGQDLFYPPNVGGWPGGRAWLATQAIIGRANYAAALVNGELSTRSSSLDGVALARRHGRGRDLDDFLAFCAELLTGSPPDDAWGKRLRAALGPKATLDAKTATIAIALAAASPEVQLV
jgi:uncharacterized protein (DUF1800 family)